MLGPTSFAIAGSVSRPASMTGSMKPMSGMTGGLLPSVSPIGSVSSPLAVRTCTSLRNTRQRLPLTRPASLRIAMWVVIPPRLYTWSPAIASP